MEPIVYRLNIESEFLAPSRHALGFPVMSEQRIISSITHLLLVRGPVAIGLFVSGIVVSPFHLCIGKRPRPHVFKEVLKRLPSLTHCNPASAVVLIIVVVLVLTAFTHGLPDCVLGSARLPVPDVSALNAGPVLVVLSPKVASGYDRGVSTLTPTEPVGSRLAVVEPLHDSQLVVNIASLVFESPHAATGSGVAFPQRTTLDSGGFPAFTLAQPVDLALSVGVFNDREFPIDVAPLVLGPLREAAGTRSMVAFAARQRACSPAEIGTGNYPGLPAFATARPPDAVMPHSSVLHDSQLPVDIASLVFGVTGQASRIALSHLKDLLLRFNGVVRAESVHNNWSGLFSMAPLSTHVNGGVASVS